MSIHSKVERTKRKQVYMIDGDAQFPVHGSPLVITRSGLREQSSLSRYLPGSNLTNACSSLQTCDLDVNYVYLFNLLEESRQKRAFRKTNKLQGLLQVLEQLQLQEKNGQKIGYLRFDVAFEIFAGHQESLVEETTFRDALLHPQHGLSVNIMELPQS